MSSMIISLYWAYTQFKVVPLESTSSPIQQFSVDDYPFEDSPVSAISFPPFLSRTKSPPISPRLSGSGLLRSPPLSPRLTLTPRGSPSSRLPQLPSNESKQDVEVTFDIRWDRLGVQAGTSTRGWFEGDASQILRKLQKVPDIRVVLLHTDSAGKCFFSVILSLADQSRDKNRNSTGTKQWVDEIAPRGGWFYAVVVKKWTHVAERYC
jgi:hypothetical protein